MKKTPYGWIYLFLAPTLILYATYTVWPILATVGYSFLSWNGFEKAGTFVGFANFAALAADPLFWNSLRATFVFMLIVVPVRVILSLFIALLVNWKRLPLRNVFRTMIFLPVVTTGAIIGVIMNMVFDPTHGPFNLVLTALHILHQPVSFLGDVRYVMGTAAGIWVWKWLGVCLIYWLASLQSIPGELYEAALVDGAGPGTTFWHITLPLLKPFAIIITILTIADSMRVFDLMMTLTGGGPYFKTEVIELFVYRWAFASTVPRLGYASSAALVFGLIFVVIAVLQLRGRTVFSETAE